MGAVPLVIAGMVVGGSIGGSWLPALLIATAVALALVSILLVPELRWRRWRYEVREQEIDIRHGAFTIRRTIVPMTRVQHVDTEQGLIQQSLDLATVSFNTAAGKNEIPHLEKREADRVRDRIAEITRDLDDV